MKKIVTPTFILLWLFVLITYVYFQIIDKPSARNDQIGISIYFGLTNAVVVYFFIKCIIKEFEKEEKNEQQQ